MSSFSVTQIGQIAIPVAEIERSVAFYQNVLGLKFLFKAPPGLGFFDCGGVRLMLDASSKEQLGKCSILYFKVDDINTAYTEYGSRGLAFENKPTLVTKMPDHELWMVFFRDPDKNLMAFMCEKR